MKSNRQPIDSLLPDLTMALRQHSRVILQAPPGAGKTTRVPLALLEEDWLAGKSILMLEPRRMAAKNAASFMAAQLGEQVGHRIGFTIRYQRKKSAKTRIEVVTEGILTRRLQQDPELSNIGLVIFDEFHERHLHSDLALALCCDIQQGLREDLRLLVMSATLDGEPLARLLGAPLFSSEGRSFPVEILYLPSPPQQNLVDSMVTSIRRVVRETSGDLLAFLPGEGEIRRCRDMLNDLSGQLDIHPLFATLPYTEQERAILPGSRRKLVLATNIAETSLTIEGICVVIDSGYCRRPRFDNGNGLTRLERTRISQASAEQRAGRAGRLAPGRCYRLWSKGTQGTLLPFTPPEIRSADLTSLALELLNWGVTQPEQLTWLDPPPEAAWLSALNLLELLDCITPQGQLTRHGRQVVSLPVHPRLGSLLLRAQQLDLLPLGCDLAALLSEADPWSKRQPPLHSSHSDLLDRLEELWRRQKDDRLNEFQAIARASHYLRTLFKLDRKSLPFDSVDYPKIATLLLSAYPDRLGRRCSELGNRYQLSSGQGAHLAERSALCQEEFLIAVSLRSASSAENEITIASAIDADQVAKLAAELPWHRSVTWDRQQDRLVSCERQMFGSLVLTEKAVRATPEECQQAILSVLRKEGLQCFNMAEEVKQFIARVNFLRRCFPEDQWPDFSFDALQRSLEDWLLPYLSDIRNRVDLQNIDLLNALRSRFDWQRLQRLERLAPERFRVPSGSQIRLQYPQEGEPTLAVKLQEMFGQTTTPTIASGRCSLIVHLLSPAGRPLQITQDLCHFWEHGYPEIRKEMKGRYPKHPWPDNPLLALPTSKTKRGLANQQEMTER